MIYGYARVSTDGQSVDTQVRRLRAAGAHRVFREVASGARADRPGLRRAKGFLTGFPCVFPRILTFANGGPVGTKMTMLMGQERLPISEPPAGLLTGRAR